MQITIPDFSLVIIVGADNYDNTYFIQQHFLSAEITDDSDLKVIETRLKERAFTVIQLIDLKSPSFQTLARIAKKYHCQVRAMVLNPKSKVPNPNVHLVQNFVAHHKQNGIYKIIELKSKEEIATIEIIKTKLLCDKRNEISAFDIIGDIHGCADELEELLQKLGYQIEIGEELLFGYKITPTQGRKVVFVGDLTDRGPDSPRVLRIVMSMVKEKKAFCVRGNHDDKLYRYLEGNKVTLSHGLELTAEQLEKETPEFREEVREFVGKLVNHYVFDDGRLVVAHGGLSEDMHNRTSGKVNSFCLYGATTGKKDEFGLVERLNWAADYEGEAVVVYGHTPQAAAVWQNNTMNIDTGCVFGGWLTALRYPEHEIVQVKALDEYCPYKKPLYR